ncbi:glycerate kinase [Allonocardiopsis opalescens]|uniref:glycerate kinase family protein n=1 Tax=Allonocardiopsis opalescens TaxID=1144618 RepID=UPI000D0530E7|nr:glycerate kinase [Allonocardiopsis opalescens]
MRIVIAPDKFAGTLTALEAARAVAEGWRGADPGADTRLLPLSDGGPGFVEVMTTASAEPVTRALTVRGPLGEPVEAAWVEAGGTAYIESAQACGLHLVPANRRDPGVTTSHGVGELIADALGHGLRRVVVGLGGSATNDGGAGLLAALGAEPAEGLRRGGAALPALDRVDTAAARERLAGVSLVAATDVDNPLLGPEGASAVFGPQKGADEEQVRRLDAALAAFADRTDPGGLRERPGSGAAGGLGYALLLLGGEVVSGISTVLDAVDLDGHLDGADVVVTGEGSFDGQSLRGKLPYGVAQAARARGVPCLVLAGRVQVDAAEAAAAGIAGTYALVDSAGSVEAAMADSAGELRRLARSVAEGWRR